MFVQGSGYLRNIYILRHIVTAHFETWCNRWVILWCSFNYHRRPNLGPKLSVLQTSDSFCSSWWWSWSTWAAGTCIIILSNPYISWLHRPTQYFMKLLEHSIDSLSKWPSKLLQPQTNKLSHHYATNVQSKHKNVRARLFGLLLAPRQLP